MNGLNHPHSSMLLCTHTLVHPIIFAPKQHKNFLFPLIYLNLYNFRISIFFFTFLFLFQTTSKHFRNTTTATKEATYNAGASVNSGFWGAVQAAKKVGCLYLMIHHKIHSRYINIGGPSRQKDLFLHMITLLPNDCTQFFSSEFL